MPVTDYTDFEEALLAAIQAIKGSTAQTPELTRLLDDSSGSILVDGVEQPFYRSFFVAADWLYANPKQIVKAIGVIGATYADLIDVVAALLRRQIRLDASSEVTIPDAMSAQKLLDEVLQAEGKLTLPKRASLYVI